MAELTSFKLELFSRGGDPHAPVGRVFEIPCPGLPAEARLFGIFFSNDPEITTRLLNMTRNAVLSAPALEKRTLQSGTEGKFEAVLLGVNRGFATLFSSGTMHERVTVDGIIGLLSGNELLLSGRGKVNGYLYRPEENEEPRKLLDEQELRVTQPQVLFRTIVSGTLREGDTLLATQSDLFDFLSLPHVSKVVMDLPLHQARTRVLELLGDVAGSVCLSGILIGAVATQIQERPHLRMPFRKEEAAAGVKEGKNSSGSVRRVAGAATALFGKVTNAARSVAGKTKNTLSPEVRTQVVANVRQSPQTILARWNHLRTRDRLLLLGALLLLIGFGESVRFLSRQRTDAISVKTYNEQIAGIQAKRDAAEANVIYKNEAAAWQELVDAEAAIHALPTHTDAQKKTTQDLLATIESDREKLRKVTHLDDTPPLLSLAQGNTEKYVRLLVRGNLLQTVSDQGGVRTPDAITTAPFLTDGVITSALAGKTGTIFLTPNTVLERVATSTVRSTIALPKNVSSTVAYATWNGRIYALAPDANQIYRGTKSGSVWNLTQAAIKEGADLFRASDLTIQTAIWVARDGEIQKYLNGKRLAFSRKTLNPDPSHFSRIWVSEDEKRIAVSDSDLKRLFLFSSDGELITQYAGGPIDDLRDAFLDSTTKTITLLTSKAVYQVAMPE